MTRKPINGAGRTAAVVSCGRRQYDGITENAALSERAISGADEKIHIASREYYCEIVERKKAIND